MPKPKSAPDSFAARLAALLRGAGLSAYRLAQLSGLSQQALSKLLSGKSAPSLETARRLCKALGVSLSHFD